MTRPDATSLGWTIWGAAAVAVALALAAPAQAVERGPYGMEILIDGRPLYEYAARGRTYIEALAGREYSVRLTNRTDRRVAIALSVDGLSSIDATVTSAGDAPKWILGPYEAIVIDGWQTSSASARRFYFTTEQGSYGAWLGSTDNLGLIAAAVFRERSPRPVPYQRPMGTERERPEAKRERSTEAPSPAPPAAASPPSERRDAGLAEPKPVLSDELAATGIGREVDHRVERVRFDAEPAAAAQLEVRYEYRDALVRLGVLPAPCDASGDPLNRRERARGFAEPGFAPDPYRRGGCR